MVQDFSGSALANEERAHCGGIPIFILNLLSSSTNLSAIALLQCIGETNYAALYINDRVAKSISGGKVMSIVKLWCNRF